MLMPVERDADKLRQKRPSANYSILDPPFTSNPNRKRILVTGGAGFIGSHLIDRLLHENHEVLCVDNFYSGTKCNIMQHLGNPNFEMIRHDVTSPLIVEVDQIFHLACPASPVHYQKNAIKTLKTNVIGTSNMLGLAKRTGARILLASTSEVYGDPEVHPQTESYNGNVNCVGIRSCYDEGKRAAEALAMDYHRQHKVDVRIARIFNTYGPRMLFHDGRVVSNFIVQALKGRPLTVYGDGSQTRSFCYVHDLVDGLMKLMESGTRTPTNLGNPTEFTVHELAKKVRDLIDPSLEIQFLPLPEDDPRKRKPDIAKAQSVLGWSPTIELDEGLNETVCDFRDRLEPACPSPVNVYP